MPETTRVLLVATLMLMLPGGGATTRAEADERRAKPDAEEHIWQRLHGAEPAEIGDPKEIPEGQMRVRTEEGRIMVLPLAHTAVEAEVSGLLARVWVTQYFTNPYDHPIEAVYVFPLPQMSAVDDMEMVIGERVIRGVMKERQEARKIYEEAKRQGKTASLLEQERPNIFTQSVANILPGDRIRVRIRYVEDLRYEDGGYEFSFPMVVGPRYIPGGVADASRIAPPVLKPGERTGHDIELALTVNSGVELSDLESPSHDINTERLAGNKVKATLQAHDTLPNKDFILRYRTAGKRLQVANLFHASKMGNYFMLLLQPQDAPEDEEVVPRELVFVVDCSGSMSGTPLAKAKEAMKKSLKAMRPDDEFQVIKFSDSANGFSNGPVPNTPENLKRALQFVDQMRGTGGTQMIKGIEAALDYPSDSKRMRIVAFMTDGYIGNENQILNAIREKAGDTRLFSFGIGSSVNRFLLDRMAEMGKGYVTYVRQDESPSAAVERFYRRIDSPVLVDVEVETEGGVIISEVFPSPVNDLFAGQPLVVHGLYKGSGKASFIITGKQGGGKFRQEIRVRFPEDEPDNGVLATLWARAKIKYFMDKMVRGEDQELVERVTALAIKYRIMSKYTSFVAVEEKARRKGGKLETIHVPAEIPEGVSYEGIFGGEAQADCPPSPRLRRINSDPAPAPAFNRGWGGGPAKKEKEKDRGARAVMPIMEKPTETAAAEDIGEASATVATVASRSDEEAEEWACECRMDSVVVLEGPVSEQELNKLFKKKLPALLKELAKAVAEDGQAAANGRVAIDLSIRIGKSGKIEVRSVAIGSTSPDLAKGVTKQLKKRLEKLRLSAQPTPTLAKISLVVSCR